MTSNQALVGGQLESRAFCTADVDCVRTARCERTRLGWDRVGHITGTRPACLATSALRFRVGQGRSLQECSGVGVSGMLVDGLRIALFHYSSAVEDDDPLGDVPDNSEVVGDE